MNHIYGYDERRKELFGHRDAAEGAGFVFRGLYRTPMAYQLTLIIPQAFWATNTSIGVFAYHTPTVDHRTAALHQCKSQVRRSQDAHTN